MIRKIMGLVCLVAVAAMSAPPVMAQEDRDPRFAGLHAGLSRSLARADSSWSTPGTVTGLDMDGAGGSLILGYSWPLDGLVYGIALDMTVPGAEGLAGAGCGGTCLARLDRYIALRAQIGQRVGRGHLYGFAGLALGQFEYARAGLAQVEDHRTGWLAGIGYEHPMSRGWILRAEAQVMDFGNRALPLQGGWSASPGRVGLIRLGFVQYF